MFEFLSFLPSEESEDHPPDMLCCRDSGSSIPIAPGRRIVGLPHRYVLIDFLNTGGGGDGDEGMGTNCTHGAERRERDE